MVATRAATIAKAQAAAQQAEQAPTLDTHEQAGAMGGRGNKSCPNIGKLSRGGNDRLAACLKAKHPAIFAQLKAGAYRRVRAASLPVGQVLDVARLLLKRDSCATLLAVLIRIEIAEDKLTADEAATLRTHLAALRRARGERKRQVQGILNVLSTGDDTIAISVES